MLGPVQIADYSTIGTNTEIYGFVEIEQRCRIGSSVIIGTIRGAAAHPGRIYIGDEVRIGDGTVIEKHFRDGLDYTEPLTDSGAKPRRK